MELLVYFDGLVQDCSNSTANALELLQSGTKPSICHHITDQLQIPLRNNFTQYTHSLLKASLKGKMPEM